MLVISEPKQAFCKSMYLFFTVSRVAQGRHNNYYSTHVLVHVDVWALYVASFLPYIVLEMSYWIHVYLR